MNDKKIRVYLAGTIYEEEPANTWKARLCDNFVDDLDGRYEFIDPDPSNECDLTMVPRDKALINSSDVVIAYIERPSFGTAMEIYHAFLQNTIPVIVINPNEICQGDLWIEAHVHMIVSDVDDAVKYIKSLQL